MKSTSKRLLALFLALTMCLSLLSVPVWAADVSGEASESAAVTRTGAGGGPGGRVSAGGIGAGGGIPGRKSRRVPGGVF